MAKKSSTPQRVYRLEVTEMQLVVIKTALEEYFRLSLNQWDMLAERLAFDSVELPKEKGPAFDAAFDRVMRTRNVIREVFEAVGRIIWPTGVRTRTYESDLIAQDMWDTIKHKLWIDNGCKPEFSVDGNRPLNLSGEPLPKIDKIGG